MREGRAGGEGRGGQEGGRKGGNTYMMLKQALLRRSSGIPTS